MKTKLIGVMLCMTVFVFMSGCSLMSTNTKTTTTTNPNTFETVVVEEPVTESGFFESKNLSNYYTVMTTFATTCKENKTNQVQAILKASEGVEYTRTEAVLMSVVQSQLIANVRCEMPNIAAPKTLVDWADGNFIALLNTGLNAYAIFGLDRSNNKTDNSPNLTNNGSGNIFFNSDGNMNPDYNLNAGEGTISGVTFNGADFLNQPIDNSVDDSEIGLF